MFEWDQPCETAYDLGFIEGALSAAWALDSEHEIGSPWLSDSFGKGWYYWFLWFPAHAHELLPDDHPLKERFYLIAGTPYQALIPAYDDREGWQAFRDTVADLALVRFVDWFPSLAEHPLAVELAESLGIGRWLQLAREDTGGPAISSFVRYDPYGCNWRRRCLPEYSYPVPLDITVDECRATFVWALQMEHHIGCAIQEIETIQLSVERALEGFGLDVERLVGTRAHNHRIIHEWLEAYHSEELQRRILEAALVRWSWVSQRLRQSDTAQPSEPIEDVVTAFDLFWSYWLSWYPVVMTGQSSSSIGDTAARAAAFPPAPDDEQAWESLAPLLGDLPLARFCYWFAEVAGTAWARKTAAQLGIGERLELALRDPGHPLPAGDETDPLASTGWAFDRAGLPPASATDVKAMFEWLEAARQRMRAVMRWFVG